MPGWWRRESRFYGSGQAIGQAAPGRIRAEGTLRSLLVLGAPDRFADGLVRICRERGLTPFVTDGKTEVASFGEQIARCRAWAAVDASTLSSTALAKRYPGGSFAADARRAERLAEACAAAGLPLLVFSSDLVFDGDRTRAASESDSPYPGGVYGASLLGMERRVRAAHLDALIIRTGGLFAEPGAPSFAQAILASGAAGLRLPSRPSEILSAAYLPDLVHAALDLLIDGESGVWHLVNSGETTWAGFAADLLGAANLAQPGSIDRLPQPRRNTALASERGWIMPTLASAISRYAAAAGYPRMPALRQAAE